MKPTKRLTKIILTAIAWALAIAANAQVVGYVTDALTGDSIAMASVQYKGHNVAAVSDIYGHYSIERHAGWTLTFSAVGYKQATAKVDTHTKQINIKLQPDNKTLGAVTIKKKRTRYSRKDNPAVELMKKVIAAKKRTKLENHDYYQYNKYQKLTLAFNDIKPSDLDSSKLLGKAKWMADQIEVCPYNNKLILPISVSETVTQHLYRKDPHSERDIIKGQNETGINDLIQTGDILTQMMKDIFTDVNIYDDQVRLLQYPFTSPIGKDAIAFYRFYITDTLTIGGDSCIALHFLPNNQQDFGFRGDIYILKDSSCQVRRCNLTIPKKSDVNFVDNMQIRQEFKRLPDGQWTLADDDMIVEMSIVKFLSKAIVIRTTRLTDYAFDPLPKQLFKGKRKEVLDANAKMQSDEFWAQYRQVELTKSESSMSQFLDNLQRIKGFKYIIFAGKALIENFVETGTKDHPSKVDIGPVNTMVSRNFIDGLRTRISAQTTANLHPQLFLKAYCARGWESKKNYYLAELTWSFNKKEYLPREFPKRTITLSSTYDIMSPSDKFMRTDKDNVFTAFKWAKVDKMMFYNRQELLFEWEEDWGFKTSIALKREENQAAGTLTFTPLGATESQTLRTTEARATLRFAPGETYINTKQRRLPVNLDAPVFTLSHTVGIKGLLGGQYNYNFTELTAYKRFWMKSWGKIDARLKTGCQWNKVPFPLLIMPAANLSYIVQDETFSLINNMEFLNDRYASLDIAWDLNGKILNRIPLIKRLKWREYLGFKTLWGTLTSRNNPFLNPNDPTLMRFPEGSYTMDRNRPYMELVAGVHNIFKILHVEYVRRLNYHDLPTANKNGIRFMLRMTF